LLSRHWLKGPSIRTVDIYDWLWFSFLTISIIRTLCFFYKLHWSKAQH
jgi:hypothetical protein